MPQPAAYLSCTDCGIYYALQYKRLFEFNTKIYLRTSLKGSLCMSETDCVDRASVGSEHCKGHFVAASAQYHHCGAVEFVAASDDDRKWILPRCGVNAVVFVSVAC